jgi:hypothetical protein
VDRTEKESCDTCLRSYGSFGCSLVGGLKRVEEAVPCQLVQDFATSGTDPFLYVLAMILKWRLADEP